MSPPTLRGAPAPDQNNNTRMVLASNDRRTSDTDTDEEEAEAGETNPPSAPSDSVWSRLQLVLGGGFNFRTARNYVDAPAYESVAANHQGGGFFLQPGYSVSRSEHHDLRLGVNYDHRFFSTSASHPTRSSFQNITLGLFGEASYLAHPAFAFGGQLRVGYTGVEADATDVGLPASANFSFLEDGGLSLGGSVFLDFWNQAFRIAGSIDASPTGLEIGVPPPDSPLSVVQTPAWSVNAGVNIFALIRNLQGNH